METQTQTPLTHWKKNNDSKYISGEDLQDSLKGLRPEMVVVIDKFEDSETFDQQNQKKITKTGLFLKEINGKALHKPVILNNTNADFFIKEFGSKFLEHWIGKPCVLYSKADKRHGFVARFKKYHPPATITPERALGILNNCKTLNELSTAWADVIKPEEKNLPVVLSKKEELKTTLK